MCTSWGTDSPFGIPWATESRSGEGPSERLFDRLSRSDGGEGPSGRLVDRLWGPKVQTIILPRRNSLIIVIPLHIPLLWQLIATSLHYHGHAFSFVVHPCSGWLVGEGDTLPKPTIHNKTQNPKHKGMVFQMNNAYVMASAPRQVSERILIIVSGTTTDNYQRVSDHCQATDGTTQNW